MTQDVTRVTIRVTNWQQEEMFIKPSKVDSGGKKFAQVFGISALVFFSTTPFAIGGSATLSNGSNYNIPDATGIYVHSPITISSAPSGATATRID